MAWRPRIAHKLFAAFLSMALVLLALVAVLTGVFTAKSFEAYLAAQERARFEALVADVADAYAAHGGWQAFYDDPGLWLKLLENRRKDWPARPPGELSPPPPAEGVPGGMPPPFPRGAPPGEPWVPPFEARFALTDAAKNPIAGRVAPGAVFEAVTVGGQTVGWVAYAALPPAKSVIDRAFLNEQAQTLKVLAAAALAVAALFAWLAARGFSAPIKRLAAGSRALGERNFAERIAVDRGDELGDLAHEFNRLAETLERYETLQMQWLADISHELRTPLAVLRGEIEAMQDGVRATGPEALASLHAEVMHLGRLVADLHALSVAESAGAGAERDGACDAAEAVGLAVAALRPQLERAGLAVDAPAAAGPFAVRAGEGAVRQIVTNLLSNALRYADKPGRVRVALARDGRDAVITVADGGPGVPDEALPRLFDRLYRVDASRSRATGGSGLGLAICKSLAAGFGGSIAARNVPGGGLEVSVRVPLVEEAA